MEQWDNFGQDVYKEFKLQDVGRGKEMFHLAEKLLSQESNSNNLKEIPETDKIQKFPSFLQNI